MNYHSKGLRRRGDSDSWEVVLSHIDPLTGERVCTYHTVHAKTQKQAERLRDELILEKELKGSAVTSKLTVRDFLERFVQYKEETKHVELSTILNYKTEVRWICKYIGEVRLCDLTVQQVNDWMAAMVADGYAPKTVSKPFRLLKQALNYAKSMDILIKNPCDFCKPPKRVQGRINSLNRSERTRMLELARAALPTPLALAIEIALNTGMRRGEICALRWSDFNELDHTISVRRALGHGKGGFYEKATKTVSSTRTIPLTNYTFTVLSAMHKDSMYLLKSLGVSKADPYILGSQEPDSRPYNPSRLGKDFTAFCKMNGFECTFHDLRHTFATMMIAGGVDVRTVSSYLGHSSASMTLNVYADVDPDAEMAAVAKIEEAFDVADPFKTKGADEITEKPDQPELSCSGLKSAEIAQAILDKVDLKELSAEQLKMLISIISEQTL